MPSGITVLLLRRLDVPLPVAVAGAVGLALTPIVWGISTAADAHALHLLLVALIVLALVRWDRLVAERDAAPGRSGRRRAARTAGSCSPPRCSAWRWPTTA